MGQASERERPALLLDCLLGWAGAVVHSVPEGCRGARVAILPHRPSGSGPGPS